MNLSEVTFSEFAMLATQHYAENKQTLRFGQAVFNVLVKARPDIANQLRGRALDPYFKDSVPDEVWKFIKSRW